MAIVKIQTTIPMTFVNDGELVSPRKGEILEVPEETAEALIADGVAEEYTLVEPTGKITITENGTDIDVAQYAKADVNVSGGSSDFDIATVTINVSGGNGLSLSLPVAMTTPEKYSFATTNPIPNGTSESIPVILYCGTCGAIFDDSGWTCVATGNIEVDWDTIYIHGDGTLTFTAIDS